MLSGTEYIVLHPAVHGIKPDLTHGRNFAISMGAKDPHRIAAQILVHLHAMKYNRGVNVMYGKQFRGLANLMGGPRPGRTHFNPFHHFFLDDVFAMASGFGLGFYEAVALGIPAIAVAHGEADAAFIRAMGSALGYTDPPAWYGGYAGALMDAGHWQQFLSAPANNSLRLTIDPDGASRCAIAIENLL